MDSVTPYFSSVQQFLPHGQCLLWRTDLLLLHIVSDSAITVSYYSIPLALIYFVVKRRDLQFRWILVLFGTFILACGTTHLMEIWTIWQPHYFSAGLIKALTAVTSLGTAAVLWPLMPHLLRIPSPSSLENANRKLQDEISLRERHEKEVVQLNDNLERMVEKRTRELSAVNLRLEREVRERELVEAALRHGDRRKDEFLATLAHELRNPLAPMRNAVEMVRLRPDHGRIAIDLIDRQLQHLTHLVDDLLEVARITHDQIKLKTSVVDLASVVGKAAETVRPLVESRNHRLSLTLPVSSVVVYGDPVRLAQILGNLLDNAAKYTEPGGTIVLTVEPINREAVISVTDSGIGIAPEMLSKIFELFARCDRSIGLAQSGLGLGLTLVHRLVEMHGGTIEAYSDGLGRGSRFVVRLPLADVVPRPDLPAEAAAPDHPTPPHRVLIIDDNRDSANSLAMLLHTVGHDVRTAYNALDGLAILREFGAEIVIMDLDMPDMDGYQAAATIRQTHPAGSLTLIALSGYGQNQDRRRAQLAGFDHHLLKPADTKALIQLLRSGPGTPG